MVLMSLALVTVSALTSLLITRLMVRAGVSDIPAARSNHRQPTPTAGGIGVLCAMAAAFFVLSFGPSPSVMYPKLPALLSLSFFIALVGLYDDLYGPPAALKFGIFIGVGCLLIYILSPVRSVLIGDAVLELPLFLSVLGTLLWVFVVINAVNFMDGANGLMAGSMVFAFAALGLIAYRLEAPQTFWLCTAAASAWLGVLPWNLRRKALIFSGDIGALLAGFIFASAVVLLAYESWTPASVYLGALIILPFLTDVLLTLLRRALKRENLLTPHREHLYQRAIASGVSHLRISLIYYAAVIVCAVLALALTNTSGVAVSAGFLAAIITSIGLYYIGGYIWRANNINEGA